MTSKQINLVSNPSDFSVLTFFNSAFPSNHKQVEITKLLISSKNYFDHPSLIDVDEKYDKNLKKNFFRVSHKLSSSNLIEIELKSLNKRLQDWLNLPSHPNVLKPMRLHGSSSIIVENYERVTLRGFLKNKKQKIIIKKKFRLDS